MLVVPPALPTLFTPIAAAGISSIVDRRRHPPERSWAVRVSHGDSPQPWMVGRAVTVTHHGLGGRRRPGRTPRPLLESAP